MFGGVYKLSALKKEGQWMPKMKLSDNPQKTTIPGQKRLYRLFDENNMMMADVITCANEVIDPNQPYLLFDPVYPYKKQNS